MSVVPAPKPYPSADTPNICGRRKPTIPELVVMTKVSTNAFRIAGLASIRRSTIGETARRSTATHAGREGGHDHHDGTDRERRNAAVLRHRLRARA